MKKFFAVLVGSVLAVALFAPAAHADVNDFLIERFDADYSLSNSDRQGTLKIKETIDVNFSDQNHGILRAIPDHYKKHRLQMEVGDVKVDGAGAKWSSYTSNGNTVLKIGDPGRTITGQHRYEINYTLHNVISFYGDHDELYWDINGDQWQQTAQQVAVALHLPDGLSVSREPVCYTGSFGGTGHDCTVDTTGALVSVESSRPLEAYQTMTIVVGFKKGYFAPAAWYETAGEYAATAAKFLTPLLLIGGTAFIHWRRYGRDPKGRRVTVPEYEAPEGLKAIEAGTIADFRTDNRDITATIIDLAIRGYIKIIETVHDRKILKDTKAYSLRLENTDYKDLAYFEKMLLRAIFTREEKGEEVDLNTLKYKLSATATSLQKEVKDDLVARGYFRKTPVSTTARFVLTLLAEFVAVIILAVIFKGGAVILGIAAATIVAMVFIILLPSRTPQGVAAKESIMGLKMYLEVAESERIKKLQSPDAPYAPESAEPKKTVELFEKLLPYAMVLGVEQKWAEKFADIYRTPPDWYQGNWTTFNALYLTSALSSGIQSSVNTAFASPGNSSSSGFGGGGFSGGGGGGGGGGGW